MDDQAPAVGVPNFVRGGAALWEAFGPLLSYLRTKGDGVFTYSDVDKILLAFPDIHIHMRNGGYRDLDDAPETESRVKTLKEKVVCYLIGRGCAVPVLTVDPTIRSASRSELEVSSLIWLEALCWGLHDGRSANPNVQRLVIRHMNRHQQLQGISALLDRRLRIHVRIADIARADIAQALRANNLAEHARLQVG